MAKRIFFSFHYQDVKEFRANVPRNSWLFKKDRFEAGFFDASIWEASKKSKELALKRLINSGIRNTSVTAVLIGDQTYARRWVRYEIVRSIYCGNKVIGVHINKIPDKNQRIKLINGPNPFKYLGIQFSQDGKNIKVYNYIPNKWIEYKDHNGWKLKRAAHPKFHGNFYKLSNLGFPVYDWQLQEGYKNFAKWVGD